MSTEAMREAFEKWASDISVQLDIERHSTVPETYASPATAYAWSGWQAATASQEALIKAALDAAAEVCEETFLRDEDLGILMPAFNDDCAEAIRQITPQQVMERMK